MDKVIKFGGSSVQTPQRINDVLDIIWKTYEKTPRMAVVVSAFGGVTDQLIALGKGAAEGKSYEAKLKELLERHVDAARQLIPQDKFQKALETLEDDFQELNKTLEGVFLIRELPSKTLDLIMSFGERFSAFIISQALQPKIPQTTFLDARTVITTDRSFGSGKVDFALSNRAIQEYFTDTTRMPIITGFIGASPQKETTTLGRGGSDYTAAIFGAAVDAGVIEIWTDVDGVMTADPRKEPSAFTIPEMSYREAMEMSHFGAKVIHPPTIAPALAKKISLHIKNTFNPDGSGTLISSISSKTGALISGVSSIDKIVLLCLQGSGLVGVCGISKRLFGALAERGINVILISQASSEHSICFAIDPNSAESAIEGVRTEFALEMQANLIDDIVVEKDLCIIAVVGENMCKTTGIAGKLFDALGKNGINVVAIAQGSSELNISIVVSKYDEIKAIRVIHEAFFLYTKTTVNVFLVGIGLIGTTLLQQVQKQASILHKEMALDIRVVALADSHSMVFNPDGIPLSDWKETLEKGSEKMEMAAFTEKMRHLNLINSVFVDCTSSQSITDAYETILNANISIVTPNKKANSGGYAQYKKLKQIAAKKRVKFLYSSNVGAGLPIIGTINELVRSGDKILKIEAILSGTLSYIFNTFNGSKVFSDVVLEAKSKGYTEPDPREDLNGMDVARKLLILARESGYSPELDDITVIKVIPEECFKDTSVDDFILKLKHYDESLAATATEARKSGKVLRYIAVFENGKGSVSLQAVDGSHPFYNLSGNDNIVAITSEFYKENPLVIKGPGAGAKVTAGKVLADIIRFGLGCKSYG